MSQITTGLRSILNRPKIYDCFQDITGARSSRRKFVRNYIRPSPGCKILDIGCGTARILDYLPDDVTYHGFDTSRRYIDSAVRRYGGRGNFTCSLFDAAVIEHLPRVDIAIAIGLLHHLNDEQVCDLMSIAQNALRDNGRLVTVDPCFSNDQSLFSHFLVSRDRGQNIRTEDTYRRLGETAFSRVNCEVKHKSWVPYTHCFMECWK
jgi:SAM-dependent methyltransferase